MDSGWSYDSTCHFQSLLSHEGNNGSILLIGSVVTPPSLRVSADLSSLVSFLEVADPPGPHLMRVPQSGQVA